MKGRTLIVVICLTAALAAVALPAVAQQSRPTSTIGELTEIEGRNTVIIDGYGYILSPRALVYDGLGRKVPIGDVELPTHVYIEFQYTPEGVVIHLLRVTPR